MDVNVNECYVNVKVSEYEGECEDGMGEANRPG